MAGVNKVIIVGNLGADPEVRTMPSGEAIATLSVATSESWNDKMTGERREQTEWHRIVFFRRQAEVCGQYLRKGSKIYVEGKLKTRKWQDQNGQERYTTEIQGEVMQMLDSRNGGGDVGGAKNWSQETSNAQNSGSSYGNNYAGSYGGSYGGNAGQNQYNQVPPRNPSPEQDSFKDDEIPF